MNKKILIAIVLILIALVLAAGGIFYWRSFKKESTKQRGEQIPSSPETTTTSQKWQYGGQAIAGKYADAEVIALSDGQYRMYYASEPEVAGFKGQIYSAVSSDGKNWTQEAGTRMEWATFPSVIKLPDGKYRIYFQNQQVIKSAISDDGLTWRERALMPKISPVLRWRISLPQQPSRSAIII